MAPRLIAGLLAYLFVLVLLMGALGATAAGAVLVPAALAAAWLGLRGGIVAAVTLYAITTAALLIAGHQQGDVVVRLGSGVGALAVLLFAGGIGRMADLSRGAIADDERLRRIIGSAPLAIYATDVNGVCTFAGGSALRSVGLVERDLVGRNFRDSTEYPGINESLARALTGEEVSSIVPFAGRTFDARFAPLGEGAELRGAIVVAVDVTPAERAFEALRGSEERLRAVTSSLPLIVLSLEPDGTISSSNGGGLRVLGLRNGALDGRSIFDLSPNRSAMRRAIAGEQQAAEIELRGARAELRLVRSATAGILASASLPIDSDSASWVEAKPLAIGEFLIEDGAITRADLDEALVEQATRRARGDTVLIGTLLISAGRITAEQLEAALKRRARDTPIGELGAG